MGQRLSVGGRVTRALAQVSKRQQGEIDAAAAAASARAYLAKQQGMQDVGPGSVPEQRLPEEMREAQAAAARASRAPEVAQESGDEEDLAVIHEKDPRLVTQLMEVDGGAAIHSEPSSALQQQLSRYYLEQQVCVCACFAIALHAIRLLVPALNSCNGCVLYRFGVHRQGWQQQMARPWSARLWRAPCRTS